MKAKEKKKKKKNREEEEEEAKASSLQQEDICSGKEFDEVKAPLIVRFLVSQVRKT